MTAIPNSDGFITGISEAFGPDQYAEIDLSQFPDPPYWQEMREIAERENLVPPFDIVQENDRLVLLATPERIVYEASTWDGEPTPLFTFHPSQAARCRRVYSRLEPYGA